MYRFRPSSTSEESIVGTHRPRKKRRPIRLDDANSVIDGESFPRVLKNVPCTVTPSFIRKALQRALLISLQSGIFLEIFLHINAHTNNLIRFRSIGRSPMAVLCSLCGGDAAEEQKVGCVMSQGNGCSECEERAVIRDKIKRLEGKIIKLKAKYRALGTTANATHDPFIHKLPPEIGSHIFHLSLPTFDPSVYSHYAQTELPQVLRLGAVCRKWRQLAWATPNLWEILSINTSSEIMHTMAGSWPGLINEWLGRSGGLPLTIFFLHHPDVFPDPEEFYSTLAPIIEVLALHSSRWRNLFLYVDPITLEHFSSMHLNQVLRLELVVSDDGPGRIPAHRLFIKFKPFPAYLRLERFSPGLIDIGWKNITEARLGDLTTDNCAEVLRRAPALERFHVEEFRQPDRPTVNVGSFIIHPRIRSLDLPAEAGKFLDMINVPSLEEWTQEACSDTIRALPVTAMVSLLKRSGCRLKILNLQYLLTRPNRLLTLFQATPFLERLEMDFMRRSNAVDDILVRIFHSPPDQHSSHESFLPRLRFLECRTQSKKVAPFSWDRIPDLYRLGHRCSLTLKSVINTSETSDKTAMELLKLVDEGAKFLISDSRGGGDSLENFKKRIRREGR